MAIALAPRHMEKAKSLLKLSSVLVAYGFTFVTIVQFAIWLADIGNATSYEFHGTYKSYSFYDWLLNIVSFEFDKVYLAEVGINVFLFALFVLQHTFMSSAYLEHTKIWSRLHSWGLDKPIYTFLTGVALQFILWFWNPIPVEVWTFEPLVDYFRWVHIFAWGLLYGTCIMLDLPDMVGLTQVVVSSPTTTAKSPELQLMYKRQRHMGLIPFVLIFCVYPYMSLDRLLLGLGFVAYTFCQCRSDSCYEYTKNMKKVKKYRID